MMDYKGILLRPVASLRKEQVWMAEGDDLAIYNANKSIIQNLLEHSGIPESDHKLWIGIYRIGANQDEARPTIVVCCLDSKLRKQAKESIKNCSLFRQGRAFAHFAVRGKATPPELPCEPQLTMAGNAQVHGLASTISSSAHQPEELTNQGPEGDIRENIEHQVVLQLFGSHTGDSYLCRPIQARRGLQRQSATAGPLLFLDGTSYQLTVEHVVNFGRNKSEPTWEHTNDDWDDDDDDDDTRGHGQVEGIVPLDFGTVRTTSEGSVSSDDVEINFSNSSSSSSTQEIERNTSWSLMLPASTPPPQSSSEPRMVSHIIVNDHPSSPQIEPISSTTCCCTSAKMDYLLFPIHVNPAPEVCTTGGAEMVQLSDVFDVHGQTEARPVIISTASLGYVQGIIFPASTLLQKPGSRSFQTLFCIESAFPMPKGTSGSAVFDSQTGLLAGYLALGCPGKHTCYMVPMCDVLAELKMLSSSIVRCQVQLNVSAIAKMDPEKSAMTRFNFHAGGLNRSVPLSSMTPREEGNNRLGLPSLRQVPGIFSKTTDRVEENPKAEKIPRNPPKFRPLRGNFIRFISAIQELISSNSPDNDEWETSLDLTRKPAWWSLENRPYFDVLRENGVEVSSELQVFLQPSVDAFRLKRSIISYIERFCEGASFALHGGSIRSDLQAPALESTQEPIAWVSDRNTVLDGFSWCRLNYPRVLDCRGLYQVLQQKRFRDDARDHTTGHPRRIYIDKPNGSSVLALIRTAPASQIEGLRKLFAGYVTPTPSLHLGLEVSAWCGGCSILSFNLPFFGITTPQLADVRTISNEKKPFRFRRSLSFLNLDSERLGSPELDDAFYPNPVLHEAVCSFMLTVKSERYWTAVFLDDDFFDEESRLSTDDETLELCGDVDPIIRKADMESTSPSAYALAALAVALDDIVDHHSNIQDHFKASLSLHTSDTPSDIPPDGIHEWMRKFQDALELVRQSTSNLVLKLDHFLSDDVILGTDGLPRGVLWRSLQSQPDALRSLLSINHSRNDLRDMEVEFCQIIVAAKDEKASHHFNKKNTFSSYPFVIAALQLWLTLLLLNFVTQLYGYRLEAVDLLTWTEPLILLVLTVTISGRFLVVCLRRYELHQA